MSLRLLVCLACSAALLLGACSGSNTTGSSNVGGDGDGDNGSNGGGGGDMGQTPLQKANADYDLAEAAVAAANAAIEAGNQERAMELIAAANRRLTAAVASAQAALDAARSGTAAAFGVAQRALDRAREYQRTEAARLQTAQASFAWYRTELVRHTFANGVAVTPKDGTNKVTIVRTPRTRIKPGTADTVEAHPDAFTSTTFETVPYADGKRAFIPSDDEFEVDGYTSVLASTVAPERSQLTGLKLKSDGLVIRTGGTSTFVAGTTSTDFTDMRKDITKRTDDTDGDGMIENQVGGDDGEEGQNGWDLAITFNEPETTRVAAGETSWMGNSDFYWRGIVPAARSQTATDGDNYKANAFSQPEGFKDLGVYEVWLSNYVGVDRNEEPATGSYPDDDDNFYLKYAAYGVFVYTPDTETFFEVTGSGRNGQAGRMQSIHYGYLAFADETGKKTTDIGTAIISGRFRGQALAYSVKGDIGGLTDAALMRGDAVFTVSIPKTTGSGNIQGTLNNFEQWSDSDGAWTDFSMTVEFPSTTIGDDGTFSGATRAGGRTDLNTEAGNFKGTFYGPRSDSDDLEVAGSWTIGIGGSGSFSATEWSIMGSFGAKQR